MAIAITVVLDDVLEGAGEVGVLDVHLSGGLAGKGRRCTGEGVAECDKMRVDELLAKAEKGGEGGKGAFV
jgi:hypothetical protein